MHIKIILVVLINIFFCFGVASGQQSNEILELLIEKGIIIRDSGQEVTKAFLSGCLKEQSEARYKIECDDILFNHYVSLFEREKKNSNIILVSQDGASVENRWIFEFKDGKYIDIKNDVWPNIPPSIIGQLLTEQTGDERYTENFVRNVAHSCYRVSHTINDYLIVRSGIPDETYGKELGIIEWDGCKFNFVPNGS